MKGYWRNPEATAATITPDGWLKTGDVAYKDKDGFYYLHDRVMDMIVSGGENIYPAEVENAVMAYPAVADCAVIGVPSGQWGETVKAIVVLAPGATVTPAELIEFTRARIAGYKVPRTVDFADALPRNPSGKVLKRELREPYWEGVHRRIN
jgi:long-chain acyl-CoA synthetase